MEAMGREAARLLSRQMLGEETGFQVRLRWHLIPRASSRAETNRVVTSKNREGGES